MLRFRAESKVVCTAVLLLLGISARAQTSCPLAPEPRLERRLRQLYLDLLGRPPTIAEYRGAQTKGTLDAADIQALLARDEFYGRMRLYHRALFKANIAASIYNPRNTALVGTGNLASSGKAADPYSLTSNPPFTLRGTFTRCDPNILQDSCNDFHEDPQNEPATKTCRDASGTPLPVSLDYDLKYYHCTQLDLAPDGGTSAVSSCAAAVSQGVAPDKYLYFCDMRRDATNALHPWLCLPDPNNPNTNVLTQEVLESATHRIVSFANPTPNPTAAFNQLDRCTLTLTLTNGAYAVQRGCVEREGYVVKSDKPFWDTSSSTQVAMCAIEAQERDANPYTLRGCDLARFSFDRTCGCGVAARRCEPFSAANPDVHTLRLQAISTEPELIADSVLRRGEPYFNILTTQRGFVNGPMSQLYLQNQGIDVFSASPPAPLNVIPNIPFSQADTWVEYARDAEHSGILTTAAYLYRFPTLRSRINEFYSAMLCTPFAPPENFKLPSPNDSCNRENNLAQRCGCNYCHATIEPMGAHWGRFTERSAVYLNPVSYPKFEPRCQQCALAGNTDCGGTCGPYVMRAYDGNGADSLGMLFSYLYRTPSEEVNIESGPALLVQKMMQTGQLEHCTVKHMWNEFVGRPMTPAEETLHLDDLTNAFAGSNHNLKTLIQQIIATQAYWRVD